VSVFIKDKKYANQYQDHIYSSVPQTLYPTNIWLFGRKEILNISHQSEDVLKINDYKTISISLGLCLLLLFFCFLSMHRKKK